jgi:putative SOS response-associated peptidase YedK
MSRLHFIAASRIEIAAHFGVDPVPNVEWAEEIVEGNRGLVVRESNGRRVLQTMQWGFPRQTREERERGEPMGRIGLVADLTNPIWNGLVVDPRYRCLIVLTHFANPDGHQGEKTRTWFSVKDQPIMAWAGFCRNTPEFGPVYAGMTTEPNEAIPPTNDRMPVLVAPGEYDRWLRGSIQEVIRFQFRAPIAAGRIVIERTKDLWRSGSAPPSARPQLPLL